jgi:glycosyltransferase involved in cell wall biosynthesis
MLYKVLSGMDRTRFESSVVSMLEPDDHMLAPRIAALGVPVESLRLRPGTIDPRGLTRLISLLRHHQPTVLQSWMYHANILGSVAAPLARIPKLAWSIRCSDLDFPNASLSLRLLFKTHGLLSSSADTVIVNSRHGMLFHQHSGHNPRTWKLIPNGFDLDHFAPNAEQRTDGRSRLGIDPNDIAIGMVARYHPFKDHGTFIHAARLLREMHSNVVFVLVGRGLTLENRELVAQLEASQLLEHTRLIGEHPDPSQLLVCFDIATLCSTTEGFPNVLGEAMSCEVPCVATHVGDSAFIIGDTGHVVPVRDPAALAMGWQTLIAAGPSGRRTLGAAARARIRDLFSLSAVVAAYESTYTELAHSA